MNRMLVSGVAAIVLLAGSVAIADNGGPATTKLPRNRERRERTERRHRHAGHRHHRG